MKNEVKNSLFNTILVAVCVFVGVGFITGAEIWFYFARFSGGMVFGILTFALLSFFLVYYSMGSDESFPPLVRRLKTAVLFLGELLIGSAMVSGLMQTTRQLFGLWWWVVFAFAIFVMIFVFWKGMRSTIIYNYFVASFIIFVIICLFLFDNNNLLYIDNNLLQNFTLSNAIMSVVFACIYIFMNISEIRPITEKFEHKNKIKNKVIFSVLITLVLIFLILTISLFLINNQNLTLYSMPLLLLFNSENIAIKFIFLLGLVLAMVSTAVACLFGLKDKLNTIQNDDKFNKMIVILSLLIIGQLTFEIFIKFVYPLVGIFNFFVFVIEIIYRSKKV